MRSGGGSLLVLMRAIRGRMRWKWVRTSQRDTDEDGRTTSRRRMRPPGFRTRQYSRNATSRSATWRKAKPMLSMSKRSLRNGSASALHEGSGERLPRLLQHPAARIDADDSTGLAENVCRAACHQTCAGRDIEK